MPLTQLKRTLEFATPGTSLYIRNEQLMIARRCTSTVSVPLEDIGVVILDDARCNITQSVLAKLAESSVAVVVSNSKHLPIGLLMPIGEHSSLVSVQRAQLTVSEPRKKRLWQDIVRAKILMQSCVLRRFNSTDDGLAVLAKRVLSGDTSNIEARAAQKYWKMLFGREFRRDRERVGLNSLLNYGYAIVRAAVSRSIVASGLLPSVGLHHHNRSNAFCLADDLIEPFRPVVDWRVKEISTKHHLKDEMLSLENRDIRADILTLLSEPIHVNGSITPLGLAVSMSVSSLKRCFVEKSEKLVVPLKLFDEKDNNPIPLRADHYEAITSGATRRERGVEK